MTIESTAKETGDDESRPRWKQVEARRGYGDFARGKNVGDIERVVSVVAGTALALFGLRRFSFTRLGLASSGGSLIYRGLTGYCSAYARAGVSTADPSEGTRGNLGTKVERSIVIYAPADRIYRFWRNFANLPRFMDYIESVQVRDSRRSHWVARGPGGVRAEWDAEIINEIPDELIAWRTTSGNVASRRLRAVRARTRRPRHDRARVAAVRSAGGSAGHARRQSLRRRRRHACRAGSAESQARDGERGSGGIVRATVGYSTGTPPTPEARLESVPPAARCRSVSLRHPSRAGPDDVHLRGRGDRHDRPSREPVTDIWLNAVELTVTAVRVENDRGESQHGSATAEPATERYRFTFATPLAAGAWRLRAGIPGHAQRQAARLLSQHVQGSRGRAAHAWRRRSSRRRTPAARFPAGTSPTSRPSSRPRW